MLAVWASLPPVRRVVWTAVIEASAILAARTSTGHRPATGGAPRDPAREFPEAGARFGRAPVVLDALAGSIYSLPWHTGVGDRNGYPLAPREFRLQYLSIGLFSLLTLALLCSVVV
jgi:hypothetical protein